jgi:glucokinase
MTRASAPGAPFHAIGIDVGGTKTAAGLVAFPEGRVLERRTIPTGARRGGEAVLEEVLRLGEELAAWARRASLPVGAVGLGICELVDVSGRVASGNCVDWRGLPARERLSSIAPATIEADVRAAALAEAMFGAGRPFGSFIHVTAGTGISSCLVLGGKPFAGARGLAGTMASSPLPAASAGPAAGRAPTLEEIAAGPAIAARYNERSGARLESARDVVAAAESGDAAAIEVVRSAAEALGAGIGWLVNVLDPEAVVIGGGLGLSGGIHRETLIASARRHIWSEVHRDLPILPAATGTDAGVIGAAAAAWLACA